MSKICSEFHGFIAESDTINNDSDMIKFNDTETHFQCDTSMFDKCM